MIPAVIVDAAGAQEGGSARLLGELRGYLARTGRQDVSVIGSTRYFGPDWLVRRELAGRARARRVALNNVGFVTPGAQCWTLLHNALHFLSKEEEAALPARLWTVFRRDAAVVRLAARRSEMIIAPSNAMAERVVRVMPGLRSRLVVRANPVSPIPVLGSSSGPVILCPVIFGPHKRMREHIMELLAAVDGLPLRVRVTAHPAELPASVASHPCIELVGRLPARDLSEMWSSSQAVYFPSVLESFGYPLAEARANGLPVIACDTELTREIAGPALCGYVFGDAQSLRHAVELALAARPAPDPAPFDPDSYFRWMLGEPR